MSHRGTGRSPWVARRAFKVLWVAGVACTITNAHAWTRSERALAGASTQLSPVSSAPATALKDATRAGALSPSAPLTHLAPQHGPQTVLRAGEIPPALLEKTTALLHELHAVQTPEQAISVDLPGDVLFDFDKAELRAEAAEPIARAAALVQGYPRAPLRVVGHTDSKGGDAYNQALSQRRAQAVADALKAHTLRNVLAEGRGETEPVAPNVLSDGADNPAGRQLNRRVQILINPLPRP